MTPRLSHVRALVLAALAVGALVAPACGVRTLPRPPEDTQPRAATDLSSKRDGRAVHLEWERPSTSMDGERLADLVTFLVERRSEGDAFTIIAEVPADTSHRLRPIKHYSYVDEQAPTNALEYRIVCTAADGQRSPPSSSAFVAAAAAPAPAPAKKK
jgi:hypothetical protein